MKKPLAGQRHHWFPKSLAKAAWVDADGMLLRTNSRGQTKRLHPSATGYGRDTHNILSEGGSPWDSTFEPHFDKADNAFPKVVDWLGKIETDHPTGKRAHGVRVAPLDREPLAECLASLIVRSPRLRFLSEKHTAAFQVDLLGFQEPHNVHQTAGVNLQRLQEPFARDIRTSGKFAFLIADETTFVFGDGLMSNINPDPHPRLHPMAMVAITPQIAVLWFSPTSYPSIPGGVSLRLSAQEVSRFNDITQIYSRDTLFHIGNPPALHEAFTEGQHYIVHINGTNHRSPPVDGWMAEVLEVWEPG